jgi:hypothetical protein
MLFVASMDFDRVPHEPIYTPTPSIELASPSDATLVKAWCGAHGVTLLTYSAFKHHVGPLDEQLKSASPVYGLPVRELPLQRNACTGPIRKIEAIERWRTLLKKEGFPVSDADLLDFRHRLQRRRADARKNTTAAARLRRRGGGSTEAAPDSGLDHRVHARQGTSVRSRPSRVDADATAGLSPPPPPPSSQGVGGDARSGSALD